MQPLVIFRFLGLLLMAFSLTMLPPIGVDYLYQENATRPFLYAFGWVLAGGVLLFLSCFKQKKELRLHDGFLLVVLFWILLGVVGSLPLYLSLGDRLSLSDAVFESISGLTTTGATILTGLDQLPHAILFYRQFLQWLGGMSIIVLAIAVMPMLGIGGMQIHRAEISGAVKEAKLTPRITETAKALWYLYLGLTISCGLAYWLAGMNAFDAVAHAFSTVSIGGFSTHDASIGYFNSTAIEMIAVVFMLLSGVNFALHFTAIHRRSLSPYLKDTEFGTYLLILFLASLIIIVALYHSAIFDSFSESFFEGLFEVVSIGTTTGFTTHEYAVWPGFLPVLLMYISYIGGCAGSSAGGIKVIRVLVLLKQCLRELRRLVHPSAQFAIKIGRKPVADSVIVAVWGYFAAYFALSALMMLLLMASGLNQDTAFSAVAACLNNLGPGLDQVGKNFAAINDFAKWVLCAAMLLGRLEIFTLLVLVSPAFWRK